MKHCPYIAWAKAHHDVRYNLASSGVRACPLERLEPTAQTWVISGPNEDGWAPLVERIAARYRVGSANVVLAHGASMANHLVCALLINPGDTVLVEHPVYQPLEILPRFFHAEVRYVERRAADGFRLDLGAIERLAREKTPALLILTNLHNPTGTLTPREDLAALGSLAQRYGFYVLVDEVYLEWLHDAGEPTALELAPRFVTTRSLTKAYGLDDLRAGWILADPELAERLRRLQDLFSVKMVHLGERCAARALERAEHLLEPLRGQIERNRTLVDALIAGQPRLTWSAPAAGTIGWVRLHDGSVEALNARLLTRDTVVSPGRFFGVPDYFRIGFGMETPRLEKALRHLAAALDEI